MKYFIYLIIVAILFMGGCKGLLTDRESKLHIKLELQEDRSIVWAHAFSNDIPSELKQKHKLTIPDELKEYELLYNSNKSLYAILYGLQAGKELKVRADINRNYDLSDDKDILIPVGDKESGVMVYLKHTYTNPYKHAIDLPYILSASEYETREKDTAFRIGIKPAYSFKGQFSLHNEDFTLYIIDRNGSGELDIYKGINQDIKILNNATAKEYTAKIQNMLDFEKGLFRIAGIAPDGEWVEIVKTPYQRLATGMPAPDLTLISTGGNEIKISDYRGKYLIIDLWPSWCKSCVEDMKKLKSFPELYPDLALLGINTDDSSRTESANRIIRINELNWAQVVSGEGSSTLPNQLLRSLSENPGGTSKMIVVDPEGHIAYGSNYLSFISTFCEYTMGHKQKESLFFTLQQNNDSRKDVWSSLELPPIDEFPLQGTFPNTLLFSCREGENDETLFFTMDCNYDGILSPGEGKEIPILKDTTGLDNKAIRFVFSIDYKIGRKAFYPFFIYASKQDDGSLILNYKGMSHSYISELYHDGHYYRLTLTDLNGDQMVNDYDKEHNGWLLLEERRRKGWEELTRDNDKLTLGERKWQIDTLHESGLLLILSEL